MAPCIQNRRSGRTMLQFCRVFLSATPTSFCRERLTGWVPPTVAIRVVVSSTLPEVGAISGVPVLGYGPPGHGIDDPFDVNDHDGYSILGRPSVGRLSELT